MLGTNFRASRRLPGLEVWNRNFFAKVTRLLHENDQKYFIQKNLHWYLHIFPTSPEGEKCHVNKTVRLLNQTSYRAILVHFRTKWSVVQRERGPVMRTDGNPTEPSLENKRHAPVFPNWTSRSFPWPVSLCVMGHYCEEKWLCVAFFDNPVVLNENPYFWLRIWKEREISRQTWPVEKWNLWPWKGKKLRSNVWETTRYPFSELSWFFEVNKRSRFFTKVEEILRCTSAWPSWQTHLLRVVKGPFTWTFKNVDLATRQRM